MKLLFQSFSMTWIKRFTVLTIAATFIVSNGTALAVDVLFYSSNGVNKYNPDDQGSRCEAGETTIDSGGITEQVPGSNNEERAWNYMIAKGLSEKQVAGMIGNWQVEAPGVNPRTHQEGGGAGRGIAQWSVDERWATLLKWKGSRNEFDLVTQLDFVWYELNGTEKSSFAALKATDSIKEATTVFMEKYERPGVPHLSERITAANTAYGRYSNVVENKLPPAETDPSIPPDIDDGCTQQASGSGGSVVQIAQAELAKKVIENPIGCDAGNHSIKGDCGPEVNKYTDNTLEYWCADFVSWVYKQAGTPFTGGLSGGWRIPGVSNVQAWFEKNATWTPNGPSANPQPGNIYVLDISHVGIVEKVEGDTIYVISGNTSVDNTNNGKGVGRAVMKNFRSDRSIIGFGSL